MVGLIERSGYCTLRRGCTVLSQQFVDGNDMAVSYSDPTGLERSIRCYWLVGADGKKGVVRKHFLEPTAGIKQTDSPVYSYDGTWIAANLQHGLPTPDTHPGFPLWRLGYSPEEVYELFWPSGWHFCAPPGKATACGKFGPPADRLWRHEFAEADWKDGIDAEELLWEHITPMITRHIPGVGPVAFPTDCVKIKRCRPFTFTHKVANRWFDGRRVMIGDAAHVFPPFGGEGIASGIWDAHQLAWRIALVQTATAQLPKPAVEQLLKMWAAERRRTIDDAARATKVNGELCNEAESWFFFFLRHIQSLHRGLQKVIPSLVPTLPHPSVLREVRAFKGVPDGFFLLEFAGGGKLAQAFVEVDGRKGCCLSDELLRHRPSSIITVLVISEDLQDSFRQQTAATAVIHQAQLPQSVLSEEPIIVLHASSTASESIEALSASPTIATSPRVFRILPTEQVNGFNAPEGYSPGTYVDRLRLRNGKAAPFAIVRPDFYIFALLQNEEKLKQALRRLKEILMFADPGHGPAAKL